MVHYRRVGPFPRSGDEMTERNEGAGRDPGAATLAGYEPPKVEQTVTPAELEQEIRYAGDVTADA